VAVATHESAAALINEGERTESVQFQLVHESGWSNGCGSAASAWGRNTTSRSCHGAIALGKARLNH
jgi:hypothetical protein